MKSAKQGSLSYLVHIVREFRDCATQAPLGMEMDKLNSHSVGVPNLNASNGWSRHVRISNVGSLCIFRACTGLDFKEKEKLRLDML